MTRWIEIAFLSKAPAPVGQAVPIVINIAIALNGSCQMPADNIESLSRLAVALAIGLLIGMERGWERRELPEGQRVAGFRTFGLVSLLGAITVVLPLPSHEFLLAAVALALGLAMALGYWRESEREPDISLTTSVAALLTFGLGALAGAGEIVPAAAAAVVVTLVLGFKPELHGLLRRIERQELLATFRLLLISVVLLPILPDRGFGPWQAIDPYRIWLLVVLVSGVSYVGYFGIKLLGTERGVVLTGLFGGLVSSTATTADLSRIARDRPGRHEVFSAGILIAAATMFPRMLVMVAVVDPALPVHLALPLLAAAATALAVGAWYARQAGKNSTQADHDVKPGNPLDLGFALRFGFVLAAIMVLARGANAWLGDRGLFVLAAVSGLVDVDAITLSVATMARQGETAAASATLAILIPAAVNTVVKPFIVWTLCSPGMAVRVAIPLIAAILVGGIAIWMFPF